MAISILQRPSDIQPAQSPIVFSVYETTSSFVTGSEFQYTANLYIWSGSLNNSGSYIYQARKFPNPAGSGIFDFSRFINSTLTRLAATDDSNIKYYKAEFGWQYASASVYVTQSGALTTVATTGSTNFKAYDGYNVFPNSINTSLKTTDTYWPYMTDMGIVTQSVLIDDKANLGGTVKGLSIWVGASNAVLPTSIECTASYDNGSTVAATYSLSALTGSTTSSAQVLHLPSSPGEANWSTYWPTTTNLSKYKFVAKTGSVSLATLNYEVVCEQYYTPVRVAYKNRFGQFDYINFFKRHDNTFNTTQRLYEPQLGTWESATLAYDQYQTKAQRYIVDATEVMSCNTTYIEQGYNELMKQLLVSDEIYWTYDQTNNLVKPLTIQTNSLQFKTGVNNKLIQYTIIFDIGQPYKLIL